MWYFFAILQTVQKKKKNFIRQKKLKGNFKIKEKFFANKKIVKKKNK